MLFCPETGCRFHERQGHWSEYALYYFASDVFDKGVGHFPSCLGWEIEDCDENGAGKTTDALQLPSCVKDRLVYKSASQKQKRGNVDTAAIIAELEAQRERLNNAITALQGSTPSRQGQSRSQYTTNGRKRHLSAAARRRISEAMKKGWAARKKVA
jgi:hypothetical protein